MLHVDGHGYVLSDKIQLKIYHNIERGELPVIHGIVVHQTDSSSAAATLNGYGKSTANGAHFLIDKDGTIFQTASLRKKTQHVGWIKSRCLVERSCTPKELADLKGKRPGAPIGQVEIKKAFPRRYPYNGDSIGIESVGQALPKNVPGDQRQYEALTNEQQRSLAWLIGELVFTLKLRTREIYRHPQISWKLSSEGSSAKW